MNLPLSRQIVTIGELRQYHSPLYALVHSAHTDSDGKHFLTVDYLQGGSKPTRELVVWRDGRWEFFHSGPSGITLGREMIAILRRDLSQCEQWEYDPRSKEDL